MSKLHRKIAGLVVAALALQGTITLFPKIAFAGETPVTDLRFSAMILGPVNQFPQFPNASFQDSVTISQGQIVFLYMNTTFRSSDQSRGTMEGVRQTTATMRWRAANCPPSSDCLMWGYRTEPMWYPWWVVVMGFQYTPYLSIDTSSNTPVGTYTIPVTVEEFPASCSQIDSGECIAPVTKNFTINVVPALPQAEPIPNVYGRIDGVAGTAFVTPGNTATITWTSEHADHCSVGSSGTQGPSGSWVTPPINAITYFDLVCTGPGGTGTNQMIGYPRESTVIPAPTVAMNANPPTVPAGGSSTVTWSAQNATSCTASGAWSGSRTAQGTESTGILSTSKTYTLSCTGPGGTGTGSATVTVGSAVAAPNVDLKVNGSDGPATVTTGTAANVTWSSAGATACSVSPTGWVGTTGNQTSAPISVPITFTLTCTGPGGSTTDSVFVTPGAGNTPTVQITANGATGQTQVPYGSAATVSWSSSNTTNCSVSPGAGAGPNGSLATPAITTTVTYTARCTGPGGTAAQSVDIFPGPTAPDLDVNPSTLQVYGVLNQGIPGPAYFTVTNPGTGALTFSVSSSQPWCSVNRTGGTTPAGGSYGLAAQVDAPLALGTRTCLIRITDNSGTAPARTVTLNYTVKRTDEAIMNISPTSLTYSAVSGAATPAAQTVTIDNPGGAPLTWFTATNQPWCTVSPSSGTVGSGASTTFSVSVGSPSNVGTFNCNVAVYDRSGQLGGQTVFVTYTVTAGPKPAIAVVPQNLTYAASVGGPTPASQQITISNTGQGTLRWRKSTSQPLCDVTPSSGTIAPGTSANASVRVTAPTSAGTNTCTVYVVDDNANNSPQTVLVTYVVGSPPAANIGFTPAVLTFSAPSGGPAPASQSATLANTGTGPLTYTISTDQPWCTVNPSSGTLAAGSQRSISVSVQARSSAGTNQCTVTVRDTASGGQRQISVIYYVGQTTAGNPSGVVAAAGSCGEIDLRWNAGSGAVAYNVYRSTGSSPSGSAYGFVYGATTYTDRAASPGTSYRYWVESVGGNGSKVAASTNANGVTSTACGGRPVQPSNAAGILSCGQVALSWTGDSSAAGYNIYRKTTNSGQPSTSDILATVAAPTATYVDRAAAGSYYYWVSSYSAGGESVLTTVPRAPFVVAQCAGDLSPSDKNIRAVNGAPQANSDCDFDQFQGLPPGLTLKVGDVITYEVNACNSSGSGDATSVVISNQLTNLAEPPGGWKVKIDGRAASGVSTQVPGVGEYRYDVSTRRLIVGVGTVPKSGAKQVTYEAAVQSDGGTTSSCPKCENLATITYTPYGGASASSLDVHTTSLYYKIQQ